MGRLAADGSTRCDGLRECFAAAALPLASFGGDDFSGLLGGVLNGETLFSSNDALRDAGARDDDLVSTCVTADGFFANIFGFSARFTGGGTDELFDVFRVRLHSVCTVSLTSPVLPTSGVTGLCPGRLGTSL